MSRYFFHLRTAQKSLVDCQGTIMPSAEAAWREANQAVQDFCQVSTGRVAAEWEGWLVDVCDERGRSLFRLAFADAPKLREAEADARRESRPPPKAADARNVVDLTVQRRKREFAMVEHRTHELVRRVKALVERNRYESKILQHMTKTMMEARQRSQELVERSRLQSRPGDWLALSQGLTEIGGVELQQA